MLKRLPAVLLSLCTLWPLAVISQEEGGSFVPGDKLLLFDDFRDMPEGAAPPHWKVRGGAVRLVDGRLTVGGGTSTRLTPNIERWPSSFTIEMNVQAKKAEEDSLRNMTWVFENGDAWVWQATLTLHANGQCSVFVEIADPGENTRAACNWLTGESNTYALWFQEDRLRIYLNGQPLVDMNQLTKKSFQSASLMVSPDAIPISFGAFRMAQLLPASNATLASGGDAKQGIQSNVGATLKPESRPLDARRLDPNALRQPVITITTPESGDVMAAGSMYPISWQYQGDSGPVMIELATASGGASLWIARSVPLDGSGTGQYSWQVFENLSPANNYIIKITSLANDALTAATGPVSIVRPSITLTSPQPGAVVQAGVYVPIKWTYAGNNFGDQVQVTATLEGSVSPSLDAMYVPIGKNGQGEYSRWLPPAAQNAQKFNVRVQSIQNPSILNEVTITVVQPAAILTPVLVTGAPTVIPGTAALQPKLQRAVAIFDTQDENKEKDTAVTVRVKTGAGDDGKNVAEIVDAASSRSDATQYPPFKSASLGLSVYPEIHPGECNNLALFISVKLPASDRLRFDTWRFKVRVELYFSDGTKVTRSSLNIVQRGGVPVPLTQPINNYDFVAGPTQVDKPVISQPKVVNDRLVSELRLVIQTGADDLRDGSEVSAIFLVNGVPSIIFPNINKWRRWIDNSSQLVTLPPSEEVTADSINGVRLTTSLGGGIAGDNWNMNSIEVIAVVNGAQVSLMKRSGNPLLYRFTGSNRDYTITR